LRDPRVLNDAHNFLQAQSKRYWHALTVCDRHGCGKEALPREELELLIENKLSMHWADRAVAIVIDPELEAWAWTDSPHVAAAIGWRGEMSVREWLQKEGLLAEDRVKPTDPKAALDKALRLNGRRRSSSLFQALASKVSLHNCIDPAF